MFVIRERLHAPRTVEFDGVIIGVLETRHGIMRMSMLARPVTVHAVDLDELEVRTLREYGMRPADILREAQLWWFGENLV